MKAINKLKALAKSLDCELEITRDNQVWLWSPEGYVFDGNGCSVICSYHYEGVTLPASCLDAIETASDGVSKASEGYEGWWAE